MTRRSYRALAVGALLATAVTGCSTAAVGPAAVLDQITKQQTEAAAVTTPGTSAADTPCSKSEPAAQASYPPLPSVPAPDALPAKSLEAAIKARGFLVVGVAGDTRLLGAWNTLSDGEPAGFDIEMAKAIGRAIFGSDGHVRFKIITAAQRFPQVNLGYDRGGVDLVARAVSATCGRWDAAVTDAQTASGSAFSVAYLASDQRLLTRPGVSSLAELVKAKNASTGGRPRVCAPAASTSIANLKGTGVIAVPVAIHSDCLALWQQGRVDAITGDDVILAGFKDQDATAQVTGDKLDTTDYALAIAKSHPEFVRYVNAVMATPGFRDAWDAAYARYLAAPLKSAPKSFPSPDYGRPLPAGAGG
ncbi:MAG TPA: transporter substrate-binding domain-containing protein [Kineosporiaceae bacterium]